jgi:alpha-L-fucosidase
VHELMSNYGKIDVLWYDVAWPLATPELWESARLNAMVRRLQPGIIIDNRSLLPEDFGTPEEHVTAENAGRDWEACMTFNGSWGYMPSAPAEDWRTVREVIQMLRTATAGQGNLLLNIGPKPDGSVPEEAYKRLNPVGKWLEINREAVYGLVDRTQGRVESMPTGGWTAKGNTAYYWCSRWPGSELAIGGLLVRVLKASILSSGQPVAFEQTDNRLVLKGLPAQNPDPHAGVTVIKLECDAPLLQVCGDGYVVL